MPQSAADLAERLGISFRDPRLLEQALIHSSYVNEHPAPDVVANERLEFLGDAVLSLVVSEALWTRHPLEPEGHLTTRRSAIVSARGLARVAQRLDLGPHIVLGQGAERSGERRRGSVLASTFEALVAAVYLDGGFEGARAFVLRAVAPELEASLPTTILKSPKSHLQELAQVRSGRPPVYRVLSVDGPDHDRHYLVEVSVGGESLGRGEGRNRRDAETEAAARALHRLEAGAAAGAAAGVDARLDAGAAAGVDAGLDAGPAAGVAAGSDGRGAA